MDDYVSRDAVFDEIYCSVTFDELLAAIDTIPAAEVVPVVRCKDCKYMYHLYWLDDETGRAIICTKHSLTGLRSDDWYCADGERRDE